MFHLFPIPLPRTAHRRDITDAVLLFRELTSFLGHKEQILEHNHKRQHPWCAGGLRYELYVPLQHPWCAGGLRYKLYVPLAVKALVEVKGVKCR
jgi:hypothetical protein